MHPSHAVPEGFRAGLVQVHTYMRTQPHIYSHAHTLRSASGDARACEMRFPLISSRTVSYPNRNEMYAPAPRRHLCDDIVMDRSLCPANASRVLICAGRNSLSHISFFMHAISRAARRNSPYRSRFAFNKCVRSRRQQYAPRCNDLLPRGHCAIKLINKGARSEKNVVLREIY